MATILYSLQDKLTAAIGQQAVFATFLDDEINPTKLYFFHDVHNARTTCKLGSLDLDTGTVLTTDEVITTMTSGSNWNNMFSGCYCSYNDTIVVSLYEKLILWDGVTATVLETSNKLRFMTKVFPTEPQYFYVFSSPTVIQKWDLATNTLVSEITQSWTPPSAVRFADYLEDGTAWLMTKNGDIYKGTWDKSGNMVESTDYAIVYTNAGTLTTTSYLSHYPFRYSPGKDILVIDDVISTGSRAVYTYDVQSGILTQDLAPTSGAYRWPSLSVDSTRGLVSLNAIYGGHMLDYPSALYIVVTWILNGSSQYEVSSKNHLIQIMGQGTIHGDAGTPPSSYWSDSFIQTADIDLENDSSITPIGTTTTRFTGIYDGGLYSISNWSYSTPGDFIGLFGITNTGCILKNIRLTGIWNLDVDFTGHGGFLGGSLENSSVYNIEGDFDIGTYFAATTANWVQGGSIFGKSKWCTIQGVTVKGSVDFDPASTGNTARGGVFGNTQFSHVKYVRNLADFPSGIVTPYRAAGICPFCEQDYSWSNVLNAMTGDIAAGQAGGIFGYFRLGTGAIENVHTIVNSMTGDLTTGGALAFSMEARYANTIISQFANYMTGNHYNGMVRAITSLGFDVTIEDCIIAPNGVLTQVDTPIPTGTDTYLFTTKYDDSFGMTFTTNVGSTTSASLSGFLDHAKFRNLPYLDISGTDDDGNSYDWDFIYGNLGAHVDYPLYTHAILHKDDVTAPFEIDYDTVTSGFDGTTRQLTFANYGTSTVYINVEFTINSTSATVTATFIQLDPFTITVRPTSIIITILDAGADAYRLTYNESGASSETVFASSTLVLDHTISNLTPETAYVVSLYLDTGAGFVFEMSVNGTTLANSSVNYDTSDFDNGNGGFDLTSVDSGGFDVISEVLNDLFITGNKISLKSGGRILDSMDFVVRGETVPISESNGILMPFIQSIGAGQTATLTLSNASTVSVTFDESTDKVTVDGQEYDDGEYFVLDGKKVSVINV